MAPITRSHLPQSAADIPEAVRGEEWARLAVNVDEGFVPLYIVPDRSKKVVRELKGLLKGASELLLATDEDREGEAIAAHLVAVLKPTVPVRRLVFHEITKTAIEEALQNTRDIDDQLVQAQESRRVLDRLVGYLVSPVLWKKVGSGLSAGRVQSPALRLIVDRERQRMAFVQAKFWGLTVELKTSRESDPLFSARLITLNKQKIAGASDFEPASGKLSPTSEIRHLLESDVLRISAALTSSDLAVRSVEKTPRTQRPRPPFITSTLQQAASGQLRFSPRRTMAAAQQLYENGYITYMRTDSATLSSQALTAARHEIQQRFGDECLPAQPRGYKTSDSRAQEAHEAIRPSGERFTDPTALPSDINADARQLYELVWRRTLASQMPDARLERTRILLEGPPGPDGQAVFQANGQVVIFDGFLRITNEQNSRNDDDQAFLPPLAQDDSAKIVQLDPTEHETRAPDRWTEASLIRELERLGIGRPSTYASILERIQDRYVERSGTSLVPRWTAFAVINLMTAHFPELIDSGFTARMEASLDQVASRELDPQPWLSEFYFGSSTADPDSDMFPDGLKHRIETSGEQIDARAISTIPLGSKDSDLAVRVGRYGPFIQSPTDESIRAQIPEEMAPDELTTTVATELLEQASQGDRTLGVEPESGLPIFVKVGRNGAYLQVGEAQGDGAKRPRTASIWPTIPIESITLEQALELLQYPRVLGEHPTSGDQVTVQDGPYGPYVRSGTENRSLPGAGDERYTALATFGLDQAILLLNAPRESRRGGQQLADLGTHPASGLPVVVRDGRYGPYVTDGELNASLPKGRDPGEITIDDAVELLAARAERVAAKGGSARRHRTSKSKSKAKSQAKARPKAKPNSPA